MKRGCDTNMSPGDPPSGGHSDLTPAIWEFEVAWGDTDAAGFVFYPNYFAWFDEAAHRFLDTLGFRSAQLFGQDRVGIPLLQAGAEFFGPLHFGDPVTVATSVGRLERKTVELIHELTSEGRRIARGRELRAWVVFGADGPRAVPIPEAVRHRLHGYLRAPAEPDGKRASGVKDS